MASNLCGGQQRFSPCGELRYSSFLLRKAFGGFFFSSFFICKDVIHLWGTAIIAKPTLISLAAARLITAASSSFVGFFFRGSSRVLLLSRLKRTLIGYTMVRKGLARWNEILVIQLHCKLYENARLSILEAMANSLEYHIFDIKCWAVCQESGQNKDTSFLTF